MPQSPRPASARRYLLLLALVGGAGLAAVWFYVRTLPMAYQESGYASRAAQRDLIADCDLGQLAVFGDSMAEAAVVPAQMRFRTTNLAFGAASPVELYYWVASSLHCQQLPHQVMLSMAGHQLEFISPFLWENNARRGFLDFEQLQEIAATARRLQDSSFDDFASPDGLHGTARNLLYGLQFPTLYFNSLVAARGFGRLHANERRYASTRAARGYTPYGGADAQAAAAAAPVHASFKPLPLQDHYFRKLVQLLADRGVRIAFVPMPVSDRSDTPALRAKRQAFIDYLMAIARAQPALVVVAPPQQDWSAAGFADAVHMAEPAARRYSVQLDACVQQALAAAAPTSQPYGCDLEDHQTPR